MGTRGGVERFDVTVERGSWLSSMSSTNNTLRMVTVKNGDTGNDGVDAGNGMGQLFIGDTLQEGNAMTAWQDAPRLLSTDGLTDVKPSTLPLWAAPSTSARRLPPRPMTST